jgi:hypothetical protein
VALFAWFVMFSRWCRFARGFSRLARFVPGFTISVGLLRVECALLGSRFTRTGEVTLMRIATHAGLARIPITATAAASSPPATTTFTA